MSLWEGRNVGKDQGLAFGMVVATNAEREDCLWAMPKGLCTDWMQ